MGIRIAFTDPEALIGRCDVAGVRIASGEPGVEDGAVVPDDLWKPLGAADAERLHAGPGTPPSTVIEVVDVPIDRAAAHATMPVSAAAFDPFAGRHRSEFLAYTDQPHGSSTTTVNEAIGLRIGIHVDNFDKLPFDQRATGRRRLGVNFGPGHRYLLIGSIDVQDVCMANNPEQPARYPHSDDIRRYVAAGRTLRLLRIRLDPGQGYIAPTELIPHDGSTLDADQPTRIGFWLGHWPTGTLGSLI